MMNLTHKSTKLFLAAVMIAALAFVIQSAHADLQLVSAASDVNGINVQEGPPLSVAFHSNSVRNPNGTRNTEIYVMDPDGGDQTRLTFDPRVDQQPDISPDGQQIAFISSRITDTNPEGDLEVFLMDLDDRSVTQLTDNNANDAWPRWSPNGKQIAFFSNVHGNAEIYLIDPDDKAISRVTEYAGGDAFPEWSPNGRQLSIARDGDIYLINLDGTVYARITDHPAADQMASWSPNGQRIAFMSMRDGYCSVYVIGLDEKDPTNLTVKPDGIPNNQFCSRAPAWSRNGQQIYFSSFRPESNLWENIFVMNADGSDVKRLTSDESTVSVAAVR